MQRTEQEEKLLLRALDAARMPPEADDLKAQGALRTYRKRI